MELEPRGMHTSLRQNLEFVMKKYFSFDFHILPQQIHIGDKIFPCRILKKKKEKKDDSASPWDPCWPIYLQTKPSLKLLDCGRKKQINIHIDTYFSNQNSDHDDKSTL